MTPPVRGIRRDELGQWDAIVGGKVVGTFRGAGAKRRAIRRAGTNRLLGMDPPQTGKSYTQEAPC